jgi:glycosyltransferase involved in cell wall biosynthesis
MLLCCWEFGGNLGAEGICTQRLVKALLQQQWRVAAAVSNYARPSLADPLLDVFSFSDWPCTARIERLMARLGYHFEPRLSWRWRLRQAAPGKTADFIYGRALPFGGLLAAAALARKLNKPLGLHFSDPIPNPWEARDRLFRSKVKAVDKIIKSSTFVTFVTDEAIKYTENQLNIPLEGKAFVLPHVAPEVTICPPSTEKALFLYAGRFYGPRRPDLLLKGFQLLARENRNVAFHILGDQMNLLQPLIGELQLEGRVELFPFTKQPQPHFARAEVLVATDASDEHPVFLTTKLIEYLNTNRKVLLVSPPSSPGSKLAARFPETVIRVEEDPVAIAGAMKRLLELRPTEQDFRDRFNGMSSFSPARVAEIFTRETAGRLPAKTHPGGGHSDH